MSEAEKISEYIWFYQRISTRSVSHFIHVCEVNYKRKESKFQYYRENANTRQLIRVSRRFENSLYQTRLWRKISVFPVKKQYQIWSDQKVKWSLQFEEYGGIRSVSPALTGGFRRGSFYATMLAKLWTPSFAMACVSAPWPNPNPRKGTASLQGVWVDRIRIRAYSSCTP